MISEYELLQPVTDIQLVRQIVREHPYGLEGYTRRSLEELDLLAELKQLGLAEPPTGLTIGKFLRERGWRHVGETGHLLLRPSQEPHWSIGLNAPSIAFVQLFE
ncbi:hypothetical protein KKC47_00095, partial [Patescibacteria group bacterium]|nr:hypothetical protein [Patescibacteria group bacterium]